MGSFDKFKYQPRHLTGPICHANKSLTNLVILSPVKFQPECISYTVTPLGSLPANFGKEWSQASILPVRTPALSFPTHYVKQVVLFITIGFSPVVGNNGAYWQNTVHIYYLQKIQCVKTIHVTEVVQYQAWTLKTLLKQTKQQISGVFYSMICVFEFNLKLQKF